MTCAQALLSSEIHLLTRSSRSGRADALLLLAHVLRRPREWLVAHGEAPVCAEDARAFQTLCSRRAAGVPVAYLIGSTWFCGREFVVNESVLVPRPETEHLVEDALGFIRGPMRVLDVATGCGAIACTVAVETPAIVDATDSSRAAIEVATENARRLGVAQRCRFHHGDLAEPVGTHRYDAIIANLPYIPTNDLPERPDPASYEPRAALDGGPDGLALYRRLLAQLPAILNEDALVLLEAAPPTIDDLAQMLRTSLSNFVISVHPDYAGLPRYVRARSPAVEGMRTAAAASESGRSQEGERPENRAQARARSASQASAAAVRVPSTAEAAQSQVSERTRAK
ncbi:MAG: peptide chain release factor N(5)-glutamine methyltransferase [Candidatus Cybelea sp.]